MTVDRRDAWRFLTVAGPSLLVAVAVMAVVGLPRVPVMAPLYAVGIVLPGCGLGRATVALARGDLALAWAYNPASFVVAAGLAALAVRTALGAGGGRWVHVHVRPNGPVMVALAIAVGALWVRQWLNADLLMG